MPDLSMAGMTSTTFHPIQNERLAGGLALILTLGALAVANFAGSGENGGVGPYVVCVGVTAILTAVLFGRVLPGTDKPLRAAWILGALALVTCLVPWSGLPFALGMGALYSGARAGRGAPAAVGALAVALGLVGCLIG